MCPDPGSAETVRIQRDMIRDRFLAYRRGHARMSGLDG